MHEVRRPRAVRPRRWQRDYPLETAMVAELGGFEDVIDPCHRLDPAERSRRALYMEASLVLRLALARSKEVA